jgi:hypothetical protein
VEPRSNRVSARQDFQRVFSVALRFLFKFTAVVREPVAPPYSLPINSAPVTYNTLLPVTISMSGQEDILDGLEVNLKRSIKFSFSSNLTPQSLLALTPAQEYYGSQIVDGRDPNDQWKAKKQTKEEKHAAKKAKLDPANQKSALDIMKERELKRKRELGMDEDEEEKVDAEKQEGGKRQKVEETADEAGKPISAKRRGRRRGRRLRS